MEIEVLPPEQATVRGVARFRREARTLARLGHPNVVAVHEVGEADGLFYLVMDFVDGPTLRDRLSGGGVAAPPEEDPFPLLLGQAYLERFEPERAASAREALFGSRPGRAYLDLSPAAA